MILRFLFFIQTFLKHCKALNTETYRRYTNISLLLLLLFIYYELRACFVRPKNTKKKIPLLLLANRRLAFCGGKKGSLKDFMVHVLTFVRQGVRIHCS